MGRVLLISAVLPGLAALLLCFSTIGFVVKEMSELKFETMEVAALIKNQSNEIWNTLQNLTTNEEALRKRRQVFSQLLGGRRQTTSTAVKISYDPMEPRRRHPQPVSPPRIKIQSIYATSSPATFPYTSTTIKSTTDNRKPSNVLYDSFRPIGYNVETTAGSPSSTPPYYYDVQDSYPSAKVVVESRTEAPPIQVKECKPVTCLAGPPGPPGVDGEPGTPGSDGTPGFTGDTASDVQPRDMGQLTCITCPEGSQGDPGPAGKKGVRGPRGPRGYNGVPGRNGAVGYPGDRGIEGPPGMDGETGPLGHPGMDGVAGRGLPGSKGENGNPGEPGPPGPDGADGMVGIVGLPGPLGGKGKSSNNGKAGDPGEPGYEGEAGVDGEYCPCPRVVRSRLATYRAALRKMKKI